jgi:hypothetical protein
MSRPVVAGEGRSTASNHSGRAEALRREAFDDGSDTVDEPLAPLRTRMEIGPKRAVISDNESPAVPFDRSIGRYRSFG